MACLPPLWDMNVAACNVYLMVQKQYIMSMNGPIDLNINAIMKVIETYEIPNKCECLEMVLMLGRHMIGVMREKEKGVSTQSSKQPM